MEEAGDVICGVAVELAGMDDSEKCGYSASNLSREILTANFVMDDDAGRRRSSHKADKKSPQIMELRPPMRWTNFVAGKLMRIH